MATGALRLLEACRTYQDATGKKVDFEKDSKGGTVHCAFTGDTLTVGGVAYRRQ